MRATFYCVFVLLSLCGNKHPAGHDILGSSLHREVSCRTSFIHTHIHTHPYILSLSLFLSPLHHRHTTHHGWSGMCPSPAARGTVHCRVVHGILSAATATSIASRFSQCGAFVVPLARTSGSHCLCHSLLSFLPFLFLFHFPSFFPLFIPFGFTLFAVLTRSLHSFASRRCVCALLMILLKFVTTTDSPCGW